MAGATCSPGNSSWSMATGDCHWYIQLSCRCTVQSCTIAVLPLNRNFVAASSSVLTWNNPCLVPPVPVNAYKNLTLPGYRKPAFCRLEGCRSLVHLWSKYISAFKWSYWVVWVEECGQLVCIVWLHHHSWLVLCAHTPGGASLPCSNSTYSHSHVL